MRRNVFIAIAYAVSALIFTVDCVTPNGYGLHFLYLIPLVYAARSHNRKNLIYLLCFCTILILIGVSAGPSPRFAMSMVIVNRFLGVAIIWLTTILANASYIAERHLRSAILDKAVIESMNEGMILAEPGGTIVQVNQAAIDILRLGSFSPEQVLERPDRKWKIFDEQGRDLPPQQWPVKRALRGEHFDKMDLRLSCLSTGNTWFVSFSGTPVYDPAGAFSVAVVTLRDETGRIEMEQQLRAAREMTEQQNRLLRRNTWELANNNKELESFSYSVSHDLRSPLQTIIGFGDLIAEDYGDRLDPALQDYVQRIVKAGRHMDRLITDLLALSRVSRNELKPAAVDLSEMARSLMKIISAETPQRKVEVHIQEKALAHADPGLIQIALDNLLRNAFKFTAKNPEARIEFGRHMRNGTPTYFVRDNGVGFKMESAQDLFKPFSRLHSQNEFPGTGIGLAIVKRIVERHGGTIWVQAEIGKGATFSFTLEQT